MSKRKGQNTAEYAILIALIIAGAIAMQTYVKRAIQGGVKYGTDKLQSNNPTPTKQYEPYYMAIAVNQTQEGYTDEEKTEEGGVITRTIGNRTSSSGQIQEFAGVHGYNATLDAGAQAR